MISVRKIAENVAAFIAKAILPKDGCAILMLHHIAAPDHNGIRINEHLKVSPDFLQLTISNLKHKGYAFLSMDEVLHNVLKNRKMAKAISLTFDDGYLDNFTIGKQVLDIENVPGIVYVATGLGSESAPIWWDALAEYVLTVSEFTLPNGMKVQCSHRNEKEQAFMLLRNFVLSLSPEDIRTEISHLCHCSLEWIDSFGGQMASNDTLRNFAADRLLSIGTHTHRHIPCGHLSRQEIESDLRKSLEHLSLCGVKAKHFAFPYGDDIDTADSLVDFFNSAGIESAVTTYSGVVKAGSASQFFMPRIFVSELDGFSERNIHLGYFQDRFFRAKNHHH